MVEHLQVPITDEDQTSAHPGSEQMEQALSVTAGTTTQPAPAATLPFEGKVLILLKRSDKEHVAESLFLFQNALFKW